MAIIAAPMILAWVGGRVNDDQRFQLWMKIVDGLFSLAKKAVPWGFGATMVFFVAQIFIAYAGENTQADVAINLIAGIQADRWVAYIIALLGTGYGLRQRKLRQRAIERLTVRPKQLEQDMDPDRSSSDILPDGRTREEDR